MNEYLTLVFLFFITITGCKTVQVTDNVLTSDNELYKITIPNNGWNVDEKSKDITVLRNNDKQAMVAIITNPIDNIKLHLNVLVNHLLIEIKNKNILKRNETTIDGLKAINVILNGKVDSNPIKMNLFVTKKDKIALNIIYWAHPDNYENGIEGFESLIKNFKFTK